MKARLLLPVLFFLGGLWYFLRPAPQHFPQKDQEPWFVAEKPISPHPLPRVKQKPRAKVGAKNGEVQRRDERDPQVIPFKVIDGLAVAFGDVILGTPEDETMQEGLFRIPTPNYWDKPEIPFAIDSNLPSPDRVKMAMRHIADKTGVRFVPYDHQPDAIVFQVGSEHCLSVLGRQGGLQPIKIAADCGWTETVHEILHSFGFIHEQSRSDRDDFVEVVWDKIEEPFRSQFEKLPEEFLGPAKGSSFDYQSVMLYGPTLFAQVKGEVTLKSRTPSTITPSRNGLSTEDIRRVKRHFNLD